MATILMEVDEEKVSRDYLAKYGLVAIDRKLVEHVARIDGGCAASLMVYDPEFDLYRPSSLAKELIG